MNNQGAPTAHLLTSTPIASRDFFARVEGVDLSGTIDEATFAAILAAFDRYAILHFPGQRLTQEQPVAFAKCFGELEVINLSLAIDGGPRPVLPELTRVSNLTKDGSRIRDDDDPVLKFSRGNLLFHTDSSYQHVQSKCSLLYAIKVPSEGGNTEYADLRAAYDDLPSETKDKVEDLIVEHSVLHSRSKIGFSDFPESVKAAHPPAHQVLVRLLEGSGRKSLYLASHASHVVGWPVEEGRKLIAELIEYATQPKYVHSHRWAPGDLVMWDNRCTMHRGTPIANRQEPRLLHRATVRDIGNSVELAKRRAGISSFGPTGTRA